MTRSLRFRFILFFAVVIGILFATACGDSEPQLQSSNISNVSKLVNLTYYTEQLPPYDYLENGTLTGFSIDLLELVTEKIGAKVTPEEVHIASWAECYQAALTQNGTVIFSTVRTPDREQSFKWAGPIYTDSIVLFAKRDRGIMIDTPEDLKGYQIGVTAGHIAIQQLLDIGVNQNQILAESNESTLITKLESGEIDLWAFPEASGNYLAAQLTGNRYKVVYHLQPSVLYYAFSKDVPDSTVQSFQEALDEMKEAKDAEGISIYKRIIGRYDPTVGLAHLNYLTEEWAPFNYQEGENVTGISVDILEAVFRDIGVNRTRADVRIVPLAEGFQAVRNETGTVLFSIVRTPEREPQFKWAGPFTKSSFVIFAPITRNITISSPEDLNQYRIGAVEDSIENDLLVDEGVNSSNLVNGKTPADVLLMLEEGRIDLWATGDLAGRHQILKTAADPDAYEEVYTLGENDFYFIFSMDVPDTLVRAFQYSLNNVRKQEDIHGISEYERIIYRYLGVGCTRQSFTNDAVIALVKTTAEAIEKNAPDTLRRINAGEAPYLDPTNPGLYVFVYTTNLTMVAHADNILLVGGNYKGKTDVTGKAFDEEILEGALKNGTGWEDYVYIHPVLPNLYYKTTYYQLTQGSDDLQYIVCSGNYKRCD